MLLLFQLFNLELDELAEIGFVGFLILMLIIVVTSFVRQWVVSGRQYNKMISYYENRLDKLEQRLRIMEMLAMRGTDIASIATQLQLEESDDDKSDS